MPPKRKNVANGPKQTGPSKRRNIARTHSFQLLEDHNVVSDKLLGLDNRDWRLVDLLTLLSRASKVKFARGLCNVVLVGYRRR
ncbi:hypothetical protein BC937DRAFT_89861 [Endogone sp. FLAS-F59071]|nr:hypothetical protein BC937DRAFT_89861 [Endogone sp. FLAS-F59071]|eukprot:RUS17525.1 hypothetical protein BC937DRAFT_89861 [Endogone sp. FLAS-F59071]